MGLQGTDEKAKSENQKHQMVFTVPRVRTDFKQGLYINCQVGGNLPCMRPRKNPVFFLQRTYIISRFFLFPASYMFQWLPMVSNDSSLECEFASATSSRSSCWHPWDLDIQTWQISTKLCGSTSAKDPFHKNAAGWNAPLGPLGTTWHQVFKGHRMFQNGLS